MNNEELADQITDKLVDRVYDRVQERLTKPGLVRRDASGNAFPMGRVGSTGKGGPSIIHSRGEQPYSVLNAIKAVVHKDWSLAPAEKALSDRLAQCGYAPAFGGIMVPLGSNALAVLPGHEQEIEHLATEIKQCFPINVDPEEVAYLHRQMVAKTMSPLDDSLGGSLIPLPVQGELIPLLRTLAVLSRSGAEQIPLPPGGGIIYPRETGEATMTFLGPNTTITPSDINTGALQLSAKRAAGLVVIPNDLVRYAPATAEGFVRRSLALKAALTEDKAFLEGAGGTIEPQGIINYARSSNNTPTADLVTLHNATTAGGTGDTFEVDDVQKMLSLVEEAPNPQGATAWVMRPAFFYGLSNLRADAVTGGDKKGPFLFPITRGDMGRGVEKLLSGLPVLTSTQVSNSRAKGGVSTLSYVLCGDFREAVIGRVGAIEIAASEHAGFQADQLWVRAIIRVDFGLKHPQSFVISDQLVIPS